MAARGGLVQRAQDLDVDATFDAVRHRLAVVEHRVREVQQLGRELVALRELLAP